MKECTDSPAKSQGPSKKPTVLQALDQEEKFDAANPLNSLPPFVPYKKEKRLADIQKIECRLLRHLRDDHGHVLTPDENLLLQLQEHEALEHAGWNGKRIAPSSYIKQKGEQ